LIFRIITGNTEFRKSGYPENRISYLSMALSGMGAETKIADPPRRDDATQKADSAGRDSGSA